MWLVLAFLLIGAVETALARQRRSAHVGARWAGNLVLYVAGSAMLLLPAVAAAISAFAAPSWGLLHRLDLPQPAALAVGVIALDAGLYALHRLSHAVEPLWRLHAVHHSDPHVDVSTTLRQHPFALLLSSFVFAAIVGLLGLPPEAAVLYAAMQTAVTLVAHAELHVPAQLDAMLAHVVVTPRVHHLHHSRRQIETDSNYGELLTLWDRLFGTWRDPRLIDAASIAYGLDRFNDRRDQLPHRLLIQPFVGPTTAIDCEGPPAMV
ncbi:MAG: hypothetical protein JWM77_3229 [Rhodospirillales bacterium]|nr:hypothetical protein [Rhodospirillales bacterium]